MKMRVDGLLYADIGQLDIIPRACSHLTYEVRIRTGKRGYNCRSEDDCSAGCEKDGWCPFIDGIDETTGDFPCINSQEEPMRDTALFKADMINLMGDLNGTDCN